MEAKQIDTLDAIFENFEIEKSEQTQPAERRAITIWLTPDEKAKYDLLQGKTKNLFGKKLKEVVKLSIDKVASKTL